MLSEDNLKKILSMSKVQDVSMVIGEVILTLDRSPEIPVRILRLSNNKYIVDTDWKIWGPTQYDPYNHTTWSDTPEDTLVNLIMSYSIYNESQCPPEYLIWVKTNDSLDPKTYQYVDGDGCYISYEEVIKRRKKYETDAQ
ncbi:MAG: hypothetical protein R6U36_12300 [Candidatus Fermentibacteraceae bacterium]